MVQNRFRNHPSIIKIKEKEHINTTAQKGSQNKERK